MGHTPYYLMFGHHPRLPVDFLLGGPEAVQHADTLEELVQRHQESVRINHEHVKQRSEEQARQRNQSHNAQVNDAGLEEGQLVYLRNHVQGRNKIQDHWNANVFRLLRRPSRMGVVYTVAPLEGGPVRHVHRSKLRAAPDPDGVRSEPGGNTHSTGRTNLPATHMPSEEDHSEDGLIVYCEDEPWEEPALPRAPNPVEVAPLPEAIPPPLRHSVTSTAGRHSNPYRLLQSVAIRDEEEGTLDGEPQGGQA